MRAEELATEFGIAGVLDFVSTQHGLVKAAISLDGVVGELYLQGAQVTAWQPRDERPVLFTSPKSAFAPGRAIRGGIPIIFPWYGPSRHAPMAPQHGFARTATWHLDGVESGGSKSLTMTLGLTDGDVGSTIWPEPFRAIYTVTFAQTLSLRLAVQNRARHPIVFEEALHTYFAISDISDIAISGLAGTTYIDKTDAARRKPQITELITVTAETDRVYLDTPGRHRKFWTRSPMTMSFAVKDGVPSIRFETHNSASMLFRSVDIDLAAYPMLAWRCYIELPIHSPLDERTREGDDHPARLFLRFLTDRGEKRAMEVIWGNRLKPGDYKYIGGFPHFVADAGDDRVGRWLDEKIDLAGVHATSGRMPRRRIWSTSPYSATATTTASVSYVAYVRLERR